MFTISGYKFPSSLFVTSEHMYFLPIEKTDNAEDQYFLCGLDDYIQQNIGLVQYIHFSEKRPETFREGTTIFSIETEKWTGFFIAPFTLQVVKRNTALLEKPTLINEDCYGKGWVVQVNLTPDTENKLTSLFYKENLVVWLEKEIAAEKGDKLDVS